MNCIVLSAGCYLFAYGDTVAISDRNFNVCWEKQYDGLNICDDFAYE